MRKESPKVHFLALSEARQVADLIAPAAVERQADSILPTDGNQRRLEASSSLHQLTLQAS
jgi:hypothetical protein